MKKSELMVITHSKKLLSYIFTITDNAPIKYRYTFITRMQNLIMDAIECLYKANDLDLKDTRRLDNQKACKTKLKMLDYISEASKDYKVINMKQYINISKQIYVILNMVEGWINSDLKRKENLV